MFLNFVEPVRVIKCPDSLNYVKQVLTRHKYLHFKVSLHYCFDAINQLYTLY